MTTARFAALPLSLLVILITALGSSARAENRIFLSTSLESSQASYIVEFNATKSGIIDRLRLTFPPGALAAGVGLLDLTINDKPANTPILTSLDPGNPNALVVDMQGTPTISAGFKFVVELVGLTNLAAGDYHVGAELIRKVGTVLETVPPIPFTIMPVSVAPGSGDITGVTAGTGLSGGGLVGNVTLSVDTAQTQKRVTGTCAAGSAVRVVNQDGTVTCQTVSSATGTVTSVGTGTGLTGGPVTTTGTISIAAGGVTTSLLADNAVTSAKLGANSVDSSKIAAGSIGLTDVNQQQIQARVTGTCAAGNAIRAIDSGGGVTCQATGGASSGWTDEGTAVHLATNADSVGIGTASPLSKFHILSAASTVYPPRIESSATSGFSSGWDFYHGSTGKGYVGVPDSAAGFGPGELIVFGSTGTKTSLWAGQGRAVTIDTSQNVGIGTTTPTARLEIIGQNGVKISGYQPLMTLQDDNASSKKGYVQSVDGGVALITNNLRALVVRDGDGLVSLRALKITGGADLSERFEVKRPKISAPDAVKDRVEPGMVVSINPDSPNNLVVSSRPYDRRVAGIISGAGGLNPGMVMGQEDSAADGKHPVALTGRVYAWVDATRGAIKPGDLLTTSPTPGHAMKVTHHAKAKGAVIGKAMTSLKDGKGLVLVLVSLQ